MTGALIVGCGRIAGGNNEADETMVLSHVVAWRRLGVPVLGCVDADAGAAARFAARWELPAHGTNLSRMLAETAPAIVSDCTPAAARGAVTGSALDAPGVRAVLAEKPLGADAATGRALIARAERAGKALIVNHPRAFDPCYREAEALVKGGALGRLQWLSAIAYGGALTCMSHLLERALSLCGPVAMARLMLPPQPADPDDPGLAFSASFADGTAGVFLPVARDGAALVELDLVGTAGRMRILDSERRVELYRVAPGTPGEFPAFAPVLPCPLPAPDWEALRHAAAAARDAAGGAAWDVALAARAADAVAVLDALRRDGRYERRIAA